MRGARAEAGRRAADALPGARIRLQLRPDRFLITEPELRMPKGYWITFYREIKNPDKLAAYAKLAPAATAPFGAKYLCRGVPQAIHEAGLKERVVVTEFPSLAQAIAAHDCPAYQDAVKVLGDGAVRDVRIIEALE